jgi:subtilisin family serine protease
MLGGPKKKKQQQRPASGWSVVCQEQCLVWNRGTSGDQPSVSDVAAVLLPATSILTVVSLEPSGYRWLFPGPEAGSSAEVKNEWRCTSFPPSICPCGMQRDCK